jgi:hypothetical protein
MKGAGMRWTLPGAQKVATLRLLLRSDGWAAVSAHCHAAGISLTLSGHTRTLRTH